MNNKTIEFHNTPYLTRELVDNWLMHAREDKRDSAEIALFEDILKMIDIALSVLVPENNKQLI